MRQTKAFTLVELVIVILLIGILSAVAVPRLFQNLDKAYDAAVERFRAESIAGLKLLRAEWLLAGQNRLYSPSDNIVIYMSRKGFPMAIDATTSSSFCGYLIEDVFGKPSYSYALWSNLQSLPDNTFKKTVKSVDWVIVSTNDFDFSQVAQLNPYHQKLQLATHFPHDIRKLPSTSPFPLLARLSGLPTSGGTITENDLTSQGTFTNSATTNQNQTPPDNNGAGLTFNAFIDQDPFIDPLPIGGLVIASSATTSTSPFADLDEDPIYVPDEINGTNIPFITGDTPSNDQSVPPTNTNQVPGCAFLYVKDKSKLRLVVYQPNKVYALRTLSATVIDTDNKVEELKTIYQSIIDK